MPTTSIAPDAALLAGRRQSDGAPHHVREPRQDDARPARPSAGPQDASARPAVRSAVRRPSLAVAGRLGRPRRRRRRLAVSDRRARRRRRPVDCPRASIVNRLDEARRPRNSDHPAAPEPARRLPVADEPTRTEVADRDRGAVEREVRRPAVERVRATRGEPADFARRAGGLDGYDALVDGQLIPALESGLTRARRAEARRPARCPSSAHGVSRRLPSVEPDARRLDAEADAARRTTLAETPTSTASWTVLGGGIVGAGLLALSGRRPQHRRDRAVGAGRGGRAGRRRPDPTTGLDRRATSSAAWPRRWTRR